MQPSDSRPPVGRGSGRPWPVAYPVPRATRRKKGLPSAWAVLFQRAVGSDPAGCASRRAHRVETAIAFRLHNALGTQNERYFVAVHPTAHSLACLRIGIFVTADAARLATGVGGSPFTGRVSHPLDGKQSFMTSPHRHSPLTSLAWSHCAPTPLFVIDGAKALASAIRPVFGPLAAIQRCQLHKRRNILGHLPEHLHANVTAVLRDAWAAGDAAQAHRQLERLAASLETDHPGAAASVREGLDDTLTLQRFGMAGTLYTKLRTTNAIENLNGGITTYSRHVKALAERHHGRPLGECGHRRR